MKFVWDLAKAKNNLSKHHVSFDEAVSVFYDPLAKITNDPDHSKDEDRFILIGYSQFENLLFIVHVYKETKEVIRIISARKATKNEKKAFENL